MSCYKNPGSANKKPLGSTKVKNIKCAYAANVADMGDLQGTKPSLSHYHYHLRSLTQPTCTLRHPSHSTNSPYSDSSQTLYSSIYYSQHAYDYYP